MKWYYVTGCDSGFGRSLTGLLHAAGHGVFAGCYLEQSLGSLRAEFGDKNVVPLQVDVTDEASVERAAQTIRDHLQGMGLDGVVNNAGLLVTPGPVEWTPSSAYEKMFKVNVYGIALVTKSVLPLIRQNRGRIVNVASIAGRMALPTQPAYCASKYAVEGYSDTLRQEMYRWGVTVHIIEPGVFPQTGLYDTFQDGLRQNWEALPTNVKAAYGERFFQRASKEIMSAINDIGKKVNKDSSLVPKAMVEALTSPRPKYRYRVGVDSKFLVTPFTKLHESWQDRLFLAGDSGPGPAEAPEDGTKIAKARYAGDPVPWYVLGISLAACAVRLVARSRM